jgi:RNA recognition motif-containing protein
MKIFVGNLSPNVTESDLQEAFAAFGTVESVAVIKDKFTGEGRGFGFVEMPSQTEAAAAIAGLENHLLGGQAIRVNEARAKTESGSAGGRRGGRF